MLGAIRLSFLDEPDEPVRRPPRRPPRGPSTDRQTLMVRRTIATGAFLLVALLLVFALQGCLDARKERAMEDYVRDANELVQLSKAQSGRLFEILSAPDGEDQSVDRQNQANELRVESDDDRRPRARHRRPGRARRRRRTTSSRASSCAATASPWWPSSCPTPSRDEERRSSTGRDRAADAGLPRQRRAAEVRYNPVLGDALAEEDVSATRRSRRTLTFVDDLDLARPRLRRRPDRRDPRLGRHHDAGAARQRARHGLARRA